MNKVTLVGKVNGDLSLRYNSQGTPVTNFKVVTVDSWKDPKGNPKGRFEKHRVVVWGKLAETCSESLQEGEEIQIEGKLQNKEFTDADGNHRIVTEIIVSNMQRIVMQTENLADLSESDLLRQELQEDSQ